MRQRAPLPWGVRVFWEVPLALVSFVFYKVVRWLLRRVANLHFRPGTEKARHWRVLSAETLKNPLALPLLMTSAPRWNTHAVVATAGALRVERTLGVDVEAAARSAQSWTLVVYTFPGFRTVAGIDSL